MSLTTASVMNNLDPFHARDAYISPRGTRVYSAVSYLDSDTPNGRYEIERLSSSMWAVTHHQVILGGAKTLTRHIGPATAKTKAMRLADLDSHHLKERVVEALLKGHGIITD